MRIKEDPPCKTAPQENGVDDAGKGEIGRFNRLKRLAKLGLALTGDPIEVFCTMQLAPFTEYFNAFTDCDIKAAIPSMSAPAKKILLNGKKRMILRRTFS